MSADTYGSVSTAASLAHRTAAHLREALSAAGFDVDRDFPALHGDTTASDEPFITLGRFRPATADRFAALLLGVRPPMPTPPSTPTAPDRR